MDARNTSLSSVGMKHAEPPNFDVSFEIEWLIGVAKRNWLVVVASVVVFLVIGIVYVVTATPLYRATTSVLIDRSTSDVVKQLSTIGGGDGDGDASVLSQVELLKSLTIAKGTVDRLKLDEDAEFMAPQLSLVDISRNVFRSLLNVSQWFTSSEPIEKDKEAARLSAALKVQSGMDVTRIGKTYALSLEFVSPYPELSARVANGIAEAYLTDKLDAKYDATRRASSWLQDRIAELRDKALESDLAVQKFRTANGLVSTGTQLVSDQQLTELNTALTAAQADVASKQARYNRIQQIISSGQMDAIVTDVLASTISNELRSKYLTASKRADQLAAILGSNHESVQRQRNEMNDYKRQMFDELRRISESYRSDVDVAEAREKSLREAVVQATGVSAEANETKVQLRELERAAESYRNLYQSFLQKFQEAVQQQSFPVTEARIISAAIVPTTAAYPRKALIVALFMIMGGAVGAGLSLFREHRDRFFRTAEQIRNELGLEMLGMAPLVSRRTTKPGNQKSDAGLKDVNSVYEYVLDHPHSSFAEAMRGVKISADLALPPNRCKIIGVVSTIPGEGKSTISINLAELIASHGARTVLIDADLRNPGATRAIGRDAENGMIEVLLEKMPIREALRFNKKSKLAFLPAVMKRRLPHSSEILSSHAMRGLLDELAASADYIIVDLPPLGPVVDARAMASNIDIFVYVVEWGRVTRRMVRNTLETEPQISEKCLGVVLNKVDLDKMKLYRAHGSSEYYYSSYSQYYTKD